MTRAGKKRALKQLPESTRSEIVRLYNEDHVLQRDIADRYRITQSLVGRLVKEFTKQPGKEQRRKAKVQQTQQVQEAVKRAVDEHTGTNMPIMSSA